jgi:hypothetical protein
MLALPISDFSVVRGAGGDGVCRPPPAHQNDSATGVAAQSGLPHSKTAMRQPVSVQEWCRVPGA